nr:hypothetical protein [uncultured Undibacterium sp.]
MNANDHTELVTTWIEHHKIAREKTQSSDSTFWAWENLDSLCAKKPEEAFTIILEILATDNSDAIIANLAAGPLEDLLARHGQSVIDRVEQQARRDPVFRNLIGGVWQNSITTPVWERLQKFNTQKW